MKKFLTMALVFVMMFSMVGCGISYSDITGDWTAKTINGKVSMNMPHLLDVIQARQLLM